MLVRLMAVLLAALASSGAGAQDNPGELDELVTSYRKMIILADRAADGTGEADAGNRAVAAARYHYARQREHLDQLFSQARRDVKLTPSNRLLSLTNALVDYAAESDRLRDGDLLAFMDLVDELLGMERFRMGESPRLAPLRKLDARIAAVFDDYREEYSRAMGALTRGEERESWDEYIAAISAEHPFDQLLTAAGDKKMVQDLERLNREQQAGMERSFDPDEPQVTWGGGLPKKTVVLSFDDGPHKRRTNKVLDILDEYSATAYFFALGEKLGTVNDDGEARLGRAAATARRIVDEGHVLANHSFDHPTMSNLSEPDRERQLNQTSRLIEALGGSGTGLFRPPYGAKDDKLDRMTARKGMAEIMWNVDSMDWADPVPESIVDRTIRELEKQKRGILLFHDIHNQTVEALPDILTQLAERGYRVVALDGQPFDEEGRGELTPPDRDEDLYGESWAVVIGINDYEHWPKLEYAVNDARSVGDTLVRELGFPEDNVIRVYNEDATRERITEVLSYEMADSERVGPNDRVFVFFSGHGMTRQLSDGGKLGYIIPVNADTERYQTRAISMSKLDDFSSAIPAKHVFFVMDSCYSGLALTRSGVSVGDTRNYLRRIADRRGRQILTAGGQNEEVADGGPGGHSIFTWTLLQGLKGMADTDGNGYVSASELGTYVTPVVSSYSEQTPLFGNLVGSGGGDFVFRVGQVSLDKVNEEIAEGEKLAQKAGDGDGGNERIKRRLEIQRALEQGESLEKTRVAEADQPGADRVRRANVRDAEALKHFQAGEYEAARKEWEKAVELNPFDPNIVNNYGYVLDKLGEYDQALKWYYRTVELAPRRTPIYLNLGDIMIKMGRDQDAIPYYKRYLHLYPSYEKADELREKLNELSET